MIENLLVVLLTIATVTTVHSLLFNRRLSHLERTVARLNHPTVPSLTAGDRWPPAQNCTVMHLAKTSPRHRPGPDLPGDKVIPPPHQNRCQSVAWTWIAGQGEVIVRCEQEPHAGNFCSWQYDGARDVRTWDQNVTPSMTWDAIAGLRLPFGKKKEEEDA